jgi:hypothetical protein
MVTMGLFKGLPPMDPRNGAVKAKSPPSEATSRELLDQADALPTRI